MTIKGGKASSRLGLIAASGRPTSREIKLNRLNSALTSARNEALHLNELALAYFIDMAVEEMKVLQKSSADLPADLCYSLTDRLVS